MRLPFGHLIPPFLSTINRLDRASTEESIVRNNMTPCKVSRGSLCYILTVAARCEERYYEIGGNLMYLHIVMYISIYNVSHKKKLINVKKYQYGMVTT